jgi:hypothetical protein
MQLSIVKQDWIGKAYVFKFRRGKGPTTAKGCLAPRSFVLGRGC